MYCDNSGAGRRAQSFARCSIVANGSMGCGTSEISEMDFNAVSSACAQAIAMIEEIGDVFPV
jgi:hypothetical protein